MSSKANRKKVHGTKPFTLCLPRAFPTMTEPDVLRIIQWYVREGDILQPPNPENPPPLLEVDAAYGEISLTVPLFLREPHRVVRIIKPENSSVRLGEQIITLQRVEIEVA